MILAKEAQGQSSNQNHLAGGYEQNMLVKKWIALSIAIRSLTCPTTLPDMAASGSLDGLALS
jgi:hypothetical protein